MDKGGGDTKKKRSPASASRRAYSLFGGIINLSQSSLLASHSTKSNAPSSSPSSLPASTKSGTPSERDPQGSSSSPNVYTVTVNKNRTPEPKTYENVTAMKKKKGDQSPSSVSSLTNPSGMSSTGGGSTGGGSGPIGPAPRTLSILTALNELAISEEIPAPPPPPHPSQRAHPPSARVSSGNNNGSVSKSNPSITHSATSTYLHPPRRSSHPSNGSNAQQSKSERGELPNPMHQSSSSIYHSTKGMYGISGSSHRAKGYPGNPPPSSAGTGPTSPSNTLPSTLRSPHKSLVGDPKESLAGRKAPILLSNARQPTTRDRSKSRTPDWIWKIFQLTKHGKLDELQESLLGLDSTLIRHLADAKGNTVLHCAARGGHVETLQWLVSVLGPQCTEAALSDHNQAGRTVILTALKKGQLECLQWLVHHTKCGEKALVPTEGERSLLHFAANFGDINVVRWLCAELIEKRIPVDIRDASGMTPLHDAAKSGHIIVSHELILAGADPLSQTELGWRPSDLAIRHRHVECASYFMVAEAAGSLGNQLHSLLFAFNHLRQEHEELRSHFREALRVGKWLAKERTEVIKNFPSKWSSPELSSSLLLGGSQNGTTRFADLEHKLVLAEQAWKKFSQPEDLVATQSVLNGEEAFVPSLSSQDFLHRRLAAVQLRHERNQLSLGPNSLSGSSDEDHHEPGKSSSSDDDSSSDDVDVEHVTSTPRSSHRRRPRRGGGGSGNSPEIIHSSAVSPPPQLKGKSMSTAVETTRRPLSSSSKAAPWLLPPNDVFLSQLSPFVGAHAGGKSLPTTLDLLDHHHQPHRGALSSSSQSLLSSIMTPAVGHSPPAAPAGTTDAAGKPDKSSRLQLRDDDDNDDDDRIGGHSGSQGKRDSTSLDISVLEVIEPTSSPSPSSAKKREDGVEPFRVSSRPWLDFSDQQKTKGVVRSLPKSKPPPPLPPKTHSAGGGDEVAVHRDEMMMKLMKAEQRHEDGGGPSGHSRLRRRGGDGPVVAMSPRRAVKLQAEPVYEVTYSNTSHHLPHHRQSHVVESVSHAPDLICGTTTPYSRRLESCGSLPPREDQQSSSSAVEFSSSPPMSSLSAHAMDHHRDTGIYDPVSPAAPRLHLTPKSGFTDGISRLDINLQLETSTSAASHSFADSGGKGESVEGSDQGASSLSFTQRKSDTEPCFDNDRDTVVVDARKTGGGRGVSSSRSPRTPSPKSYVTKLTVIPVEATTETCFLSIRSTSFARADKDDDDEHHHQLQLPGESQDSSSGLSCQIPNDSVSSSNTPVMPRFGNSSGTVVFPFRKPDWHSTELLSLPTPDSSLAGRLSPCLSEMSRTESALAPPPSYVSHASQNSEASKTESAQGGQQGGGGEVGPERDLESPGAERPFEENNEYEFVNRDDDGDGHQRACSTKEHESQKGAGGDDGKERPSFDLCSGSVRTDLTDKRRHDDDDNDGNGDNDGRSRKSGGGGGGFASQRIQARPCFIRSHLSTNIHKTSAQRLPKGVRTSSKPWYEIEGSDDEGGLLRVAKNKTKKIVTQSSSHYSGSSSTTTDSEGEKDGSGESESDNRDDDQSDPENRDDNGDPLPAETQSEKHDNSSGYL